MRLIDRKNTKGCVINGFSVESLQQQKTNKIDRELKLKL